MIHGVYALITMAMKKNNETLRYVRHMIRINRQSGYFDKYRKYQIFIDDISCGNIGDGEAKKIAIENGQHTICLKIDWCRSNILNFTVNDNKEVEFLCGNSMKGFNILLPLLYITVFKNKYLFIKMKDDAITV